MKELLLSFFIVFLSMVYIFSDEPVLNKREIILKPSTQPVPIEKLNNGFSNPFVRELDTLFNDDGNVSTGYHGPRDYYWVAKFVPARPCTVKAAIFQMWSVPSTITVDCTLLVWDANTGIHPWKVVDGPATVKAASVPVWNRADFTGGYTDPNEFWIGFWFPYAHDTLWCATDSFTDYHDRKALGHRLGSGWNWVTPDFKGDLMIRAIVSYGASDIDVIPDTIVFKLILPSEEIVELSVGERAEDTVRIDDGILSGWGTNGGALDKEAVKLTPAGPCTLFAVLYYPGDPNNQLPILHWSVWDDDGLYRLPGTQVAYGTVTNPVYWDWNRVNLPVPVFFMGGSFYAGWEDLTLPGIYMALDNHLDGYNYWCDDSTWVLDNFFPGDFMIRGLVHYWQPSDTDTVQIMEIHNLGIDSLFVDSIIPQDSWIVSISPNTLRIPAKGIDYVAVTVTRDGLSGGTHYSSLSIFSNDPDENPCMEPVKFIIQYGGGVEEKPSAGFYNYCVNFLPNPMGTKGKFVYTVPVKTKSEISIYDVSGRLVRRFVERNSDAGTHSVLWDRKNRNGIKVSQGIYFYHFISKGYKSSGKITIIK